MCLNIFKAIFHWGFHPQSVPRPLGCKYLRCRFNKQVPLSSFINDGGLTLERKSQERAKKEPRKSQERVKKEPRKSQERAKNIQNESIYRNKLGEQFCIIVWTKRQHHVAQQMPSLIIHLHHVPLRSGGWAHSKHKKTKRHHHGLYMFKTLKALLLMILGI